MKLKVFLLLAAAAALRALGTTTAFDDAVALYAQRKDAEAVAAFTALEQVDQRDVRPLLYLGRLAMRARRVDDAIKLFERAVSIDPGNSAAHGELGGAYGSKAQDAGLIEKASLAGKSRKSMERAVELDPKNADARYGLVQFYSQAPSMLGGGMDKAHAQADALIRIDAGRGLAAKAGLLVREKKFDVAFALYRDALQKNPGDYASLYAVGRLAAETGRNLDAGLDALRLCLTIPVPANQPSHAAAHWRIGNILEKKGDPGGAKSAYQASLASDPKFTAAQVALKKLA